METLVRNSTFQHTTIRIETQQPTQFVDVTDRLETLVEAARLQTGLLNIQSLHTTAAIVVNEHEPLLLHDVAALLERVVPKDALYRHDNISLRGDNCVLGERPNGHSHCRALFLGPGACLNIAGGRLQLGRWQRVLLAELDGPRTREVSIVLVGEQGR